jgi:23S rRNA pseudouridine955/2504/2580 synthase
LGVQLLAVSAEDSDIRLDRWFRRHFPDLGHGRLEKLLRTGHVRLDGKRAAAGDRLRAGQIIRVPPLESTAARAPKPPFEPDQRDLARIRSAVLHRDASVIVIDKPAGLAVQGGTEIERHLDAMLDGLRFDGSERPRLVHRLDKDTSGVLVLARSALAARKLAESFREKDTKKIYWAIVVGLPQPRHGRIDLPLAKIPGRGGERVAIADTGKSAVTLYRTVAHTGRRFAWLALNPLTGRTHQLRAHMAALGTPILGDGKYGGAEAHPPGIPEGRKLHLHARALSLPHPDGGTLTVTAPLPPHMKQTWAFLGFDDADEPDPFANF